VKVLLCTKQNPSGQQRCELSSLNASNREVIGTNSKHRCGCCLAEIRQVIRSPVRDRATDSCSTGGLGYLRKSCASKRFDHNRMGSGLNSTLDCLWELRALIHGVVIGKHYFHIAPSLCVVSFAVWACATWKSFSRV